jgi:nanoRNase/pAp phosphatase (c-di-AMP/oligoRNAs hydrolase)
MKQTETPDQPNARDVTIERDGGDGKPAQLESFLTAHRGERHIIVLQSFPDPDGISSALAHQMMSARHSIDCDIAYDGVISHQENIALVELLSIQLTRVQENTHLNHYNGSVFIDNQGTTTGLTTRLADAGVPVLAIVDHHEPQGIIDAEFTDIRPATGATATIYTQYIENGLLKLDRSDPDHVRLATALMHGIRSETLALVNAKRAEFRAAGYLSDYLDPDALAGILANRRSRNAMDVISAALKSRIVRDNYSIAGVGYLRYEDRDAIPQAADFLLTEEYVHTAIVYGMLVKKGEQEVIVGSLRTQKATLNPDTFLKEALGASEPGRHYGGGRRLAGGFEIPIGFLAGSYDDEYMRSKWRLYEEQIRRKLWAKLGVPESGAVKVEPKDL